MKKLLLYFSILIVITGMLILFVSKNYPENILEVCLKSYASPELVDSVVKKIGSFDYFNIYDIFSKEDAISVYSGNINLFLYDKNIQRFELTFNDDEVIMGENYMYEYLKYDALGGKYKSEYGEYYINCIIENNDRIYYRDLKILESSRVKNQKIYISLLNSKNILMNPQNKLLELENNDILYAKSIAYIDVINFLKQLIVLLLIIYTLLIIITLNIKSGSARKKIASAYKNIKYDLEFREFLIKKESLKLIIKYIFYILLQVAGAIIIIYLVAKLISIPVSYSIDIRSMKSIINAVLSFVDLLKYYYLNGFTEISSMIVKIIMIYFFTSILFIIINIKLSNKKISSTK